VWLTRGIRCPGPRQGGGLADAEFAPPLANRIEACTHALDFGVGRWTIAPLPCAHAAIDKLFGAPKLGTIFSGETLAAATQLSVDDTIGAMERGGVAARRELAKDPKRDAVLALDDEVREVMRDQ
jgi:hypothetical protein